MTHRLYLPVLFAALAAMLLSSCRGSDPGAESLDPVLFADPPREFGVDTWWHWSGSNISREGIRKDLLAMHANGIKRATILDVNGPRISDVPAVEFDSPQWHEMFLSALEVADSLGIQIGVHNCAGWSTSGGPWITPEKSNKTYVWSKTYVSGGTLDLTLPEPPSLMDYYEDYAILAYPARTPRNPFAEALVRAGHGGKDIGRVLTDLNPKSVVRLSWGDRIDLELDAPKAVSKLATFIYNAENNWSDVDHEGHRFILYSSDDGQRYTREDEVLSMGVNKLVTDEVKPFRHRFVRIIYEGPPVNLAEVELCGPDADPAYREDIPGFLQRLYHVTVRKMSDFQTRFSETAVPVPEEEIRDLTPFLSEDGKLRAELPEGEWCILRFGYTTTGVTNAPATDAGRGLESDKMDGEATAFHFDRFVGKLVREASPYVGRAFSFVLTDSWECLYTGWTAGFPASFHQQHGYDIRPWLPALCGEIVGDRDKTTRFFEDYSATIADLVDRNYYRKMMELAHQAGLEFHSEPVYGDIGPYPPLDILQANAWCDLPMFEFWANVSEESKTPQYKTGKTLWSGFPIESSLFTGKKVVGSEAYTGFAHFSDTPQSVAPFGNAAFCAGINQMIMHSYVHQPLDGAPHLTLTGYFGGHYNRNNPWYNLAKGWFDYQARVQYVLQKGDRVTDVLYYVGDQLPQDINFAFRLRVPKGYRPNIVNYGYLDQAVRYPVLVIPVESVVGEETARKLSALEKRGLKVIREKEGEPLSFDFLPDLQSECEEDHFMYIHKTIGEDEVYFLFNQEPDTISTRFLFRVEGKSAEIWDPESGAVCSAREQAPSGDGRTCLPLTFQPYQTKFVVFKRKASAAPRELVAVRAREISGWQGRMEFDPCYDGPLAPLDITSLKSLSEFESEPIRHFAGVVTYHLKFDLPEGLDANAPLAIDFGKLSAAAEVMLNGAPLRPLWHDGSLVLTDRLRGTGNELTVRVGTSLRNRMVGDLTLYGKLTHVPSPTALSHLKKGDEWLLPSGLIGPVSIVQLAD